MIIPIPWAYLERIVLWLDRARRLGKAQGRSVQIPMWWTIKGGCPPTLSPLVPEDNAVDDFHVRVGDRGDRRNGHGYKRKN